MDEKELAIIGEDKEYWWFKAKNELVKKLAFKYFKRSEYTLNAGCGTTNFTWCVNSNSRLESLTYPKNHFSVVILADVLEHIEHREFVLDNLYRMIEKEGKLIITVPANNWLFNGHDKFLGHYLRYDKKTLLKELENAGFKKVSLRYWNSLLFTPICIRKLLNKEGSDLKKLPKWLNTLLYKVLKLEEIISLPYGISLVGVFEK